MNKKKDRQNKHGGEGESLGPQYVFFANVTNTWTDAWSMGDLTAQAFVDKLLDLAQTSAGRSSLDCWGVRYAAEQLVQTSRYQPVPEFMRRWVDLLMSRLNEAVWCTGSAVVKEATGSDKQAAAAADLAIKTFTDSIKSFHLDLALKGDNGPQPILERDRPAA